MRGNLLGYNRNYGVEKTTLYNIYEKSVSSKAVFKERATEVNWYNRSGTERWPSG
jgi:hypothetical protein